MKTQTLDINHRLLHLCQRSRQGGSQNKIAQLSNCVTMGIERKVVFEAMRLQ